MNNLAETILQILAANSTAADYNTTADTANAIANHIIAAKRSWHPEIRREARDLERAIRRKTATRQALMEYAEA